MSCGYLVACILIYIYIISWSRDNIQTFVWDNKKRVQNSKEDFNEAVSWEDESNALFQYVKASDNLAIV